MSPPSRRLVALLVLALAAPVPAPAEPARGLRVRVPSHAGTAVRRALLSAKRRLGDDSCRALLHEFRTTAGGRPLAQVLDERGRTPESHLDSLVFADGSYRARCASPAILAFTHVGGDTIWVCAASFRRATERDPDLADVVLIHEALHTLGLGENPPTSGEITARVAEGCLG